jgi:NHL repeat
VKFLQNSKVACLLLVAMLQAINSEGQLPIITTQPASRYLWVGGNVTFAIEASGTGPFTYQWQLDSTNLPNNIISTVAGNGTNIISSHIGDGGRAISGVLDAPYDVAVDVYGNLFIADRGNHRIRQVNTNGIITTVAGKGIGGSIGSFSGDGGLATNANFNLPSSVVVDAYGNLFVADCNNNRIREVNTNGIITTVAGNGSGTYSGDGSWATNASLQNPYGVTVDVYGNLFIADSNNNRVRKVDTNGIIVTVAGGGKQFPDNGGAATNASLNRPYGITVDAYGNFFFVDEGSGRICEVNSNGTMTTVAGGGGDIFGDGVQATDADLSEPDGVAGDTAGNLFVADTFHDCIREVNTNGIIFTVAGNFSNGDFGDGVLATNTSLFDPFGVRTDAAGDIFIADTAHNRIRKVTNTQGPILALNNVTMANTGNYQVVVTGSSGSVTSNVANLIVANSPLIYQTVLNADGSIALNFLSQPNSTNVVLCATNLSPPIVWMPISTNLAGADGNWQFTDTNSAGYQAGFYRSAMH